MLITDKIIGRLRRPEYARAMRILVVEDEVELAGAIAATLRGEGFGTDVAHTVEDARFHADVHPYDAVVLDRRLPDGEGLDLCRQWRAAGVSTPVLMLTALDDTADVVAGLEGGADDYLTKPFATEVLIARIRSLIRRGPVLRKSVIEAGGVEIDPARRRVKQDGVVVPLTAKEFALLEFLAHRAGEVVDRFDILEHCWDHAYEPESNVVDVHVRGLRRKLGDGVVETVRGAGYRVPENVPDAPSPAPGQVPTGTVTVVFTDIVDSTATTERVGDRRWLELLADHNTLIRAHLAEHGGYEVKSTGDGFMLAFGSARAALECAIGIQRGLASRRAENPDQLKVRIGMHTGEPIWGESDFHGRGVALAARIGAKAGAEEILCSTLTRELTESLGDFSFDGSREVKLKGLSGRHRVHIVSWQP
jgi:two-component system copper resistance phosphate regulon response regulator CusR